MLSSVPWQKTGFAISFKWFAKFHISVALFCFFFFLIGTHNEHYSFNHLKKIFTLNRITTMDEHTTPPTLGNNDCEFF